MHSVNDSVDGGNCRQRRGQGLLLVLRSLMETESHDKSGILVSILVFQCAATVADLRGGGGGGRGHVPPVPVVLAHAPVIAACNLRTRSQRTASITSFFSPVAKRMCLPLFQVLDPP